MEIQRLVAKLRDRAARSRKDDDAKVAVSFSTAYAVYVHENLAAKHPIGQAKFLEEPARTLSSDGTLATLVREQKQAGRTTAQALLVAGLRLQREAQLRTPVDRGFLKASAATTLE